jgi:hypothetical protein
MPAVRAFHRGRMINDGLPMTANGASRQFDAVHHTAGVGGVGAGFRLRVPCRPCPSTWVACSTAAEQPALRHLFGNLGQLIIAHPHVPN